MTDGKKNRLLDKLMKRAVQMAEDNAQLKALVETVKRKLEEIGANEKLQNLINTVKLFIKMIKSYVSGDYNDLPKKSLILILLALIYFIFPMDIIPDFIPVSGFIDDVSVLLWVYNSIQDDIAAFEEWQNDQTTTINID
ncbi:MAG: DUF1232 domain-containing protein [Cyclobacteriaceae bacterium]